MKKRWRVDEQSTSESEMYCEVYVCLHVQYTNVGELTSISFSTSIHSRHLLYYYDEKLFEPELEA